MLGHLELGDFTAELFSLLDIGKRAVQGALGGTQSLGRHQDAAFVEKLEDLVKAAVFLADQVGQRHPDIFENHLCGVHQLDAHLPSDIGGGYPGVVRFHQDQAQSPVARCGIGIGGAKDAVESGKRAAVGDKNLAAVDDPFIPLFHRGGIHPGDVGTVVRFRKGTAGEDLSQGNLGQPAGLHLLTSEMENNFRGKVA